MLRLLGISSDFWQMVYKNELTPSNVDTSYSTLSLFQQNPFFFFKKAFFPPSWQHRSAFLSVLSYALRCEDPREFLCLSFQMHILGTSCCSEYSFYYIFWLLENFFFKFIVKSRVKDLLLAMLIECTHLFRTWLLFSVHGAAWGVCQGADWQSGMFQFWQSHLLALEPYISHLASLGLSYLSF